MIHSVLVIIWSLVAVIAIFYGLKEAYGALLQHRADQRRKPRQPPRNRNRR